ncbi:hypothetical protein [Aeromonas veronii]|uniref:hypothetical protein n=1 Tax=Aeromonas veronii TaxID=654 RepID=UPI002443E306|nr:hypothetical protein [Aeromonas veronii]
MTILANISSLEDMLLHLDLSHTERRRTDDLLAAIRSEAIQLSHQEFQHSNSASTPGVASAVVLRG